MRYCEDGGEQVKGKAEVRYGIENFHCGVREFAMYDNTGYLLQFGRRLV